MDIRSLRYFVTTVQLNSFTQAAESMHVTQSTISKMVRQLEDEVGEALLIRHGRKLVLTDAGRIVFERGQEMLNSMRLLNTELQDTKALQRGHLTVGIPPMINLLFTPVLKEIEPQSVAPELYPYGSRGPEGAHYLAAKYGVRWGDIMSTDDDDC